MLTKKLRPPPPLNPPLILTNKIDKLKEIIIYNKKNQAKILSIKFLRMNFAKTYLAIQAMQKFFCSVAFLMKVNPHIHYFSPNKMFLSNNF